MSKIWFLLLPSLPCLLEFSSRNKSQLYTIKQIINKFIMYSCRWVGVAQSAAAALSGKYCLSLVYNRIQTSPLAVASSTVYCLFMAINFGSWWPRTIPYCTDVQFYKWLFLLIWYVRETTIDSISGTSERCDFCPVNSSRFIFASFVFIVRKYTWIADDIQ